MRLVDITDIIFYHDKVRAISYYITVFGMLMVIIVLAKGDCILEIREDGVDCLSDENCEGLTGTNPPCLENVFSNGDQCTDDQIFYQWFGFGMSCMTLLVFVSMFCLNLLWRKELYKSIRVIGPKSSPIRTLKDSPVRSLSNSVIRSVNSSASPSRRSSFGRKMDASKKRRFKAEMRLVMYLLIICVAILQCVALTKEIEDNVKCLDDSIECVGVECATTTWCMNGTISVVNSVCLRAQCTKNFRRCLADHEFNSDFNIYTNVCSIVLFLVYLILEYKK